MPAECLVISAGVVGESEHRAIIAHRKTGVRCAAAIADWPHLNPTRLGIPTVGAEVGVAVRIKEIAGNVLAVARDRDGTAIADGVHGNHTGLGGPLEDGIAQTEATHRR